MIQIQWTWKSAIAAHCFDKDHSFNKYNIKKEIIVKAKFLNAWKSYLLNEEQNNALNKNNGPILNSKL